MSRIHIELKDENRRKIIDVASRTGRTQDEIVNEAVAQFVPSSGASSMPSEAQRFRAWREAMLAIEGMWADRDDLPDFAEVRKGWDRDVWSR